MSMTTTQMLATWRFRMEDPNGDKWSDSVLTQLYQIFTDAQRIGVNLLVDAKKFEYLRELESFSSHAMSGGSDDLPSDYYRAEWLKNSNNDFVDLLIEPPRTRNNDTFFLREDTKKAYGYIWSGKLYLQGYGSSSGTYALGYIIKPSDIDGSNDPALSDQVNSLTINISEFIGWGIDRQFDRQKEVDELMFKIFGVRMNQ